MVTESETESLRRKLVERDRQLEEAESDRSTMEKDVAQFITEVNVGQRGQICGHCIFKGQFNG